jgi:hypothetical protein
VVLVFYLRKNTTFRNKLLPKRCGFSVLFAVVTMEIVLEVFEERSNSVRNSQNCSVSCNAEFGDKPRDVVTSHRHLFNLHHGLLTASAGSGGPVVIGVNHCPTF